MEQTKAAENLSQWFNLAEQKPWQVGVYKVPSRFGGPLEYFSYWCGRGFHGGFDTPKDAFEFRNGQIERNYTRWRGLSSDPSAKPKARGNRKVTRYVVMAQHKVTMAASCDGSFESKQNAEARMEQTLKICGDTHNMWIQKIRFRTPEASQA